MLPKRQSQETSKDADSAPGRESHAGIWVKQLPLFPTKRFRNHSVRGKLVKCLGRRLLEMSLLSQNMTLSPGRNRPKLSVFTWLPPCHHSSFTEVASPSVLVTTSCSFCSGSSCSDGEMKPGMKGCHPRPRHMSWMLDITI